MSGQSPATPLREQRIVRVFVSSTFRDMQAERDELVKRIFPELRKLCEERGVTWSEVDLRWGITEEQSQRGEVLPICLAEIQRCRPYFIGLLGERYGWVPDEIPRELIDQEPWLAEHLHRSVTELEILHGVLNDPKMADHALFYFRDHAYIDSLASAERKVLLELADDAEIARFGQAEAERRAEDRRQKLEALKGSIRARGLRVKENYPDPQSLGKLVLSDLTEIIEGLYPKGIEPDPLDREALGHEAFAQSRASVYVGRQSYFDQLDEHARTEGPPLVVFGDPGSGKSALLSNWALRYRSSHPGDFLLVHCIGATPSSTDWAAMLRRIMAELKRHLNIEQEIPDKPHELREAFGSWLHMAGTMRRVVLIIDALNQLEELDRAPDLVWLPQSIPANIRLILSTSPGRSLDDLNQRGWLRLNVTPLRPRERLKLLWRYLRLYSKRLSKPQRRHIATADQTASPLYLRALLDELRIFGIYEELDDRIEYYLTATSIEDLYGRILERYERDYERARPRLVSDAMSLLWAARRGLAESELLELLGRNRQPLPRAHLSPLFLAAEQSLLNRSGLLAFSNDYLRRAVETRYLDTRDNQQMAHLRLANYFEGRPLSLRKLDEQPWQDKQSEQWANLRNTLTDLPLFEAAWDNNRRPDWISYWTALSGRYSPESSYEAAVARYVQRDGPTLELARIMQYVGWLLYDMGRFEASLPFTERALAIRERELPPDDKDIAASLNGLAEYFRVQRRYSEARPLFERSLAMLERSVGPDSPQLATALNNLSVLCLDEGDYDFALVLSKRGLGIAETAFPVGDPQRITSLLNLGQIYLTVGDYENARRYFEQALASSERFLGSSHPLVADSLEHMGTQYGGEANEAESVKCYERALAIRREIFGENHPSVATCLHNLAASANAQGKFADAKDLYQRAFQILETVYGADHVRLTECLSALGSNYQTQGKYADAIELAERVLAIRERVFHAYSPEVAEIHNRLGELNTIVGHFEKALQHHEKALGIREQLHGREDISVAQSLNNLAELDRRLGEYDLALPLDQRALAIRTRVLGEDHVAVAESLNNIGVTWYQKGEQKLALEFCQRSLKIKECQLGTEHPLVADTLNNLGQILAAEGDLANALPLHKRALEIRERYLGREHPSVGESLNNLGLVFNARGETAKALEYYQQALEIKEKVFGPEHPAVAGALNNLAVANYQSGRRNAAAQLFRRSLSICEKILGPNHPETEHIRRNLHACESESN